MQRTRIEWADFTWNAIVGCAGTCDYCYARRLATTRLAHLCPKCATFEPHLHEERLWQPYHGKAGVVFADSMSDWWSPGVEQDWRTRAFRTMDGMGDPVPAHQFVLLTKRPERITDEDIHWLGRNIWLGVSITSGADWWRWEALASLPGHIHKLVSVEPLLSFGIGAELLKEQVVPEWIIVGPQSGPGAVIPDATWQDMIRFAACDEWNIPLFEKFGLPLQPPVRQMPAELKAVFQKGGLDI